MEFVDKAVPLKLLGVADKGTVTSKALLSVDDELSGLITARFQKPVAALVRLKLAAEIAVDVVIVTLLAVILDSPVLVNLRVADGEKLFPETEEIETVVFFVPLEGLMPMIAGAALM